MKRNYVFIFILIQESLITFFFFQAEDGIRDYKVTGVQTCALPISHPAQRRRGQKGEAEGQPTAKNTNSRCALVRSAVFMEFGAASGFGPGGVAQEIGRAACRGRV